MLATSSSDIVAGLECVLIPGNSPFHQHQFITCRARILQLVTNASRTESRNQQPDNTSWVHTACVVKHMQCELMHTHRVRSVWTATLLFYFLLWLQGDARNFGHSMNQFKKKKTINRSWTSGCSAPAKDFSQMCHCCSVTFHLSSRLFILIIPNCRRKRWVGLTGRDFTCKSLGPNFPEGLIKFYFILSEDVWLFF